MTDAAPKRISREDAQSEIDGRLVAEILRDFGINFHGVYPDHVLARGVGPEQSMIGLAIKRGHIILASEHAALIREAEAERDEAQRLMQMRHREMLAADELMRKHQGRSVAAEADRDRLAAANAVLEAKVAGLREAVDEQTKARAQHWLRRTMTAPEDAEVEALCERRGYGAVMDAASRLWARKPHGSGAFYIGGCIGFKSDEEARAALATQEAGNG